MKKIFIRFLPILCCLIFLTSCQSKNCKNHYNSKYIGSVKVGKPYVIKNQTYIPKIDSKYEEIGLASWYGHRFHCKKTANGEFFNKHQLSAAHKTLPLPSVVRVTNLSNNRSIEVIINDRGPFVKGRIIDLSEKAAHALGMKHMGVAKVHVKFLPHATNKLMKRLPVKKKIYHKT